VHIPRFLAATLAIRQQLATGPDLIGYALDAELLVKRFWTVSVWESQEAIDSFAAATPHRTRVESIRPKMERVRLRVLDRGRPGRPGQLGRGTAAPAGFGDGGQWLSRGSERLRLGGHSAAPEGPCSPALGVAAGPGA
jgi:hypothetical protein